MSEACTPEVPELRYSCHPLLSISIYILVCALYYILAKVYWFDRR